MKKHGKPSSLNVEKKRCFFYHALNHSFCRVARKIASSLRRKLSGTAFKKAESFADRDMVCRIYAAEFYDLAVKFADAGSIRSVFSTKLAELKAKEKKIGLEKSSRYPT